MQTPLSNLQVDKTPEHISFATYHGKNKTPGAMFVGGTGRPDLLGQEYTVRWLAAHGNTLAPRSV
jgi:hypothetical protein